MLWRNLILRNRIAPLAPSLPPLGAGAHAMLLHYLQKKFLHVYR